MDGELCCGSAGTYNLEQPELAHELGERKATNIHHTGAEAVVTGNIGCMTQIANRLYGSKATRCPSGTQCNYLIKALVNLPIDHRSRL